MRYDDMAGKLNMATLAAVFDQAPFGIALIDTRLRFIQVNNPFINIMSMTSERLTGSTIYAVMSEKLGGIEAEQITAVAAQILTNGGIHTAIAWQSPGSLRYVDWTLKRLEVDEVAIGLLLTIADVSKHVELKQELETYQQQLAVLVEERTTELCRANESFYTAFNATPTLMSIKNQQGRIIDVNSSFLTVTGWKKEAVTGRTVLELGLYSLEVIEEIERQFFENGYVHNLEAPFTTKDGQTRFALFSAEKIILENEVHMLGMITDITERKLMEGEMVRLDRLNLVGQMAAAISHEVRNPMTTVRGFLQMLLKKCDCNRYQDYFELMISELDRANSIISEFLSVAKTKPSYRMETDLNVIIKTIEPLLTSDAVAAGNAIVLELGNVRRLFLNEREIRQLLLNLIRNSFEAMEQPGLVTVRTYEENDQVVLVIQDEGSGIPPQILAKLGTPFLTSKSNGTGLGLAVCYGIVERHKGKIEVTTSTAGTTFYIRFSQ